VRSAAFRARSARRLTACPGRGVRSDPNRPDDPEYIVRLVGQVIRVSLETVKLVKSLPAL
jgi:predicted helicase